MPTPAKEEALRLKRLTYAKYLHRGASVSLRSPSPLAAAEGLLRLHDSIEIFQSVVLDKIGVPKQQYGAFIEFWERVKEKVNVEPPYKDRFRALNDLRNSFKHHAVLPNPEEVRDLAYVVPLFFGEMCKNVFGLDFGEISLSGLLPEGELRNRVKAAERLMETKELNGAATELAIAMEILFGATLPDTAWGEPWSNLFVFSHVTYEKILSTTGELGDKATRAINDCFDEAQSQIDELRHIVSLITWGVDLRAYLRFRRVAPDVARSAWGDSEFVWRNGTRPTADDVGFCLQFVIDTALNVEARRLAPPSQPSV